MNGVYVSYYTVPNIVILMIWSENKVIYSRCRFKKLNRREFQYSDLFISNEFRAELILKTVPVHENILWLKSWDCIISRWHVIIMQHLIYKYMFKTYFQGKSLLRKWKSGCMIITEKWRTKIGYLKVLFVV